MKISIVTVVYNNPQVGEALDSILAQRLDMGDELELVVIDGGSNVGTLRVLENYRSRVQVLVSERDGGIYEGMNKGLERATGDIIGTLNSDDLYYDDRVLANVLDAFREGQAEVVYGDLVYVRKNDPSKIVRYWKSKPFEEGLFERGWMPPHPTFFARTGLYRKYGRFDVEFRLAADFDLTLRLLAKARVPFQYIPKVLVRMRLGGATNNSLRNIFKANLECHRACRKNGLTIPMWFIARKILSRVPQFINRSPPV